MSELPRWHQVLDGFGNWVLDGFGKPVLIYGIPDDDPRSDPSGTPGEYVIGETPIGGAVFPWQTTLLSQYANSPRTIGIIESFADAIDQQSNLDAFYDKIWNIATAEGYGLDVWGRIVVVDRVVHVTTRFFGFAEALPTSDPYNVSPFYGGQSLTSNYALSDSAYRQLIIAKALANICDGSIPSINRILQLLFPLRGRCYVTDPGDMTMKYVFEFPLSAVELAIVETSNVLPRPTGVSVSYSVVS
jgi:hypothetical protein